MKYVVIVAGGKGQRMGSDLPKQFLLIDNKPILMHTIETFYSFDNSISIVLVLPDAYIAYWKQLIENYNFKIKHKIVPGGETRFHSVKNGLNTIKESSGWIAIHDAVRPFVSEKLIKTCFEEVKTHKAVIPVIEVTDTLRYFISSNESKIADRSKFKMVQAPQFFELNLLKNAYMVEFNNSFTDDASVVEAYGQNVHLVEGEKNNIKITTPFDIEVAKVIKEQK